MLWTQGSFVLMAQAVGTLLLPLSQELNADDLRKWLPPPADLLEIAKAERAGVALTRGRPCVCEHLFWRVNSWRVNTSHRVSTPPPAPPLGV